MPKRRDREVAVSPGISDASRSLSRNTMALHVNTVVAAVLGFAFLILAARLYSEERLGRDMALVSAMILLSSIAELNLSLALVRFLPQLGKRSGAVVVRAYLVSSVVALVLSVGFVLIAPNVSASLAFLGNSAVLGISFVVAVLCWNIFALHDAVLTAIRNAIWIPIANAIYAIAKIALMAALAGSAIQHGVFYGWAIPAAVLVVPLTWALFKFALPAHGKVSEAATAEVAVGEKEDTDELDVLPSTPLADKRSIRRYIGLDYLSSVLALGGTSALPLIVVVMLGAEANASFAIAFAIAVALEQLASNVGLSLTAEGAFNARNLARLTRRTFVRFGAFMMVAVGGAFIAAPLLLWPFGEPYSDTASTVLRLLLIGTLPQALVILYESVQRVRGKAGTITFVTFVQMALTLGLAVFLSVDHGIAGVGWAWIIGHLAAALIALPTLIKVMFPRKAVEETVLPAEITS